MIDVNQFTVATEIFPSHLRSQASSIAISGIFLVDCLWLDLQTTALAKIGWKYYLVFLCLGLVHTIHLYFYLPEVSCVHYFSVLPLTSLQTSGAALEEIDAVFGKEIVAHLTDENLEKISLSQVEVSKAGQA